MSLSILIVEDEPIIADDIALTLEQNGYTVVGIANHFDQARTLIEQKHPDLILLDIIIKGNQNGIDLGNYIYKNYAVPFLYLTSLYDTKTLQAANETAPVGYIVKPFKEADLLVGIQMGWKKHKLNTSHVPNNAKHSSIFVRDAGSLVPIQADNISWIEGSDNYAYVYNRNEKLVVTQTLKSIAQQLPAYQFCRIHKSYIVNLHKIERIEHSVVFVSGKTLPIGKSYRKQLLDALTIW